MHTEKDIQTVGGHGHDPGEEMREAEERHESPGIHPDHAADAPHSHTGGTLRTIKEAQAHKHHRQMSREVRWPVTSTSHKLTW